MHSCYDTGSSRDDPVLPPLLFSTVMVFYRGERRSRAVAPSKHDAIYQLFHPAKWKALAHPAPASVCACVPASKGFKMNWITGTAGFLSLSIKRLSIMEQPLHTNYTKTGTVCGTLLVLLFKLNSEDLLASAVLAVVGASVSFLVSVFWKWVLRKMS